MLAHELTCFGALLNSCFYLESPFDEVCLEGDRLSNHEQVGSQTKEINFLYVSLDYILLHRIGVSLAVHTSRACQVVPSANCHNLFADFLTTWIHKGG